MQCFRPKRGTAALGVWSGICEPALALGPLVGGVIVEGVSWQHIFRINVPVGAVFVCFRNVVAYGSEKGKNPFGFYGNVTACLRYGVLCCSVNE